MDFTIFIRVFIYFLWLIFIFSSEKGNKLIRVGGLLVINFFDRSWIVNLFYGQVRKL